VLAATGLIVPARTGDQHISAVAVTLVVGV
jgi:hypothetical protein